MTAAYVAITIAYSHTYTISELLETKNRLPACSTTIKAVPLRLRTSP